MIIDFRNSWKPDNEKYQKIIDARNNTPSWYKPPTPLSTTERSKKTIKTISSG